MAILGYDQIFGGPFTNSNGNNQADGNFVTAAEPGTNIDFHVYLRKEVSLGGTCNLYGAAYKKNGTIWELQGSLTIGVITTTEDWHFGSLVIPIVPADYLQLYWADANTDVYIDFVPGPQTVSVLLGPIGGVFPATINNSDVSYGTDAKESCYMTYTPTPTRLFSRPVRPAPFKPGNAK